MSDLPELARVFDLPPTLHRDQGGVPPHAPPILDLFVEGKPEPGGSKRAFKHKSTGNIVVTDANPKAKPWQETIRRVAGPAHMLATRGLEDGPLRVEFEFTVLRPKKHYRSGRLTAHLLRDDAPPYPTGRPDVLKLTRAAEDALTGHVWTDDAQTVHLTASKRYGAPAGVQIKVWRA